MPFKIGILSRYLFREIINYFIIFLSMTIAILLISQIYDMRNHLMDTSPPLRIYALYMLYSIPADLAQVLPIIALISTMFSYGILAKNKEILAMVAAGISFRSLAKPALLFGIVVTALLYWFNESVVPAASVQSKILEQVIKGGIPTSTSRRKDLFVKGKGNSFIFIERYLLDRKEMIYPTIFEMSDNGGSLVERLEADRATLVNDSEKESQWSFENAERWQFNPDGTLRNYQHFVAPVVLPLTGEIDRYLSRTKNPDQMNYAELRSYLDTIQQMGGANTVRYSISLQQKLSFPIACLLLALLGYSVVADVHARRFAQGVFGGLTIAVVFYICNAMLTSIAAGGSVRPVLACWLPIAGFAVILYFLMLRLNRVRG